MRRPDLMARPLISSDITLDKALSDIDAQIEVLSAIAQDNPILNEQLRVTLEARDLLLNQATEIERLTELLEERGHTEDGLRIIDPLGDQEDRY